MSIAEVLKIVVDFVNRRSSRWWVVWTVVDDFA
jgi:hypothetical protein